MQKLNPHFTLRHWVAGAPPPVLFCMSVCVCLCWRWVLKGVVLYGRSGRGSLNCSCVVSCQSSFSSSTSWSSPRPAVYSINRNSWPIPCGLLTPSRPHRPDWLPVRKQTQSHVTRYLLLEFGLPNYPRHFVFFSVLSSLAYACMIDYHPRRDAFEVRWDFNNGFIANFLEIERVKEIGQYFTKSCLEYCRLFFSGLGVYFYRAVHFSANARYWDRMSSVRPSVCLWRWWFVIT